MNPVRFPSPAPPGSTILIVSTARKVSREEIQFGLNWLNLEGYNYELSPYLFEVDNQFAGSDHVRRKSLQWALDHPDGRVIWCARGGYGTARLIDGLDWKTFIENPKWISGYSDVTAFHGTLYNLGFASIHSTMILGIQDNTTDSLKSMKEAWQGNPVSISCPSNSLNVNGQAQGRLIGGNLSVLYSILSSPSQPDLENSILFIEDLDEYLYHIDRMMLNLSRSGWWNKISGLVVGGMSDMNDNTVPFGETANQIIARNVGRNIPVMFGFPAGHEKDNRAIVLGAEVEIQISDSESKLRYL